MPKYFQHSDNEINMCPESKELFLLHRLGSADLVSLVISVMVSVGRWICLTCAFSPYQFIPCPMRRFVKPSDWPLDPIQS